MNIYQQVKPIFLLFPFSDRIKILLVTVIQTMLALLDLIGIALIGLVGAISIYGIQSKSSGNRVNRVLEFLNLESQTFQYQVIALASLSVFLYGIASTSFCNVTNDKYLTSFIPGPPLFLSISDEM